MLSFVFFLAALLIVWLLAFFLTRRSIFGRWVAMMTGAIFHALRLRNRKILFGVVTFLVAVALLEALIPAFHNVMEDMQYVVGDGMGGLEPAGVAEFGTGGGLSWALYLSLLFGIVLGGWAGTWIGCKSSDTTAGASPFQVFV